MKKLYVQDKTVITFDNADDWKEAAELRGLTVTNKGTDDEFFAEEDDITMIGYFKDDWGMLS